jgi:hypothetical protein
LQASRATVVLPQISTTLKSFFSIQWLLTGFLPYQRMPSFTSRSFPYKFYMSGTKTSNKCAVPLTTTKQIAQHTRFKI